MLEAVTEEQDEAFKAAINIKLYSGAKKKKGCPDRNRGEKRPIQEESVRDNDGLVKRQKSDICVHVISAWCTCGWLHPLACVPSH